MKWLIALPVVPALLVLLLPLQLVVVYAVITKDDRPKDRLVELIQALWGRTPQPR
jgi:hypothetical protein